MTRRLVRHQYKAGDPLYAIGVLLKLRVPEILREIMPASAETQLWRVRIGGEHQRECEFDDRPVRPLALPFEIEHLEVADSAGTKVCGVYHCVSAIEQQHVEALIAQKE